MAASTEQKLDYLLKKIGFTASKTGLAEDSSLSGTKKAPFAESIPSPLVTPSTTIWNESALIPATPPDSDTAQVRVYLTNTSGHRMTADNSVSGSRAFIAYSTFNNTSSEILGDWIDPQFGDSYIIKVYKGDPNSGGTLLSAAGAGSNDTWFFDYSSGVLNFNGTVIPSGVNDNNIYIVGYRYIGVKGLSIAGINTTVTSIFNNLDITGVSTFTGNINANDNIVGDDATNISGINSVTATSFFGALTGDVTGNAGTATSLATARNIGGESFDGTSDIDLPGVNTAGDQNTSGTAAGLSGSPDINVNNIVGTALSISGIGTIGNTLKVGTGITAHGGIITATTFDGSLETTNLSGTITNAQLAGSISNDKLANSTVSYGGVSLSLGGSDATPAFDLQHATNYPFTSLTGVTTSIVGDTTPQLGGSLDLNNKFITGSGGINVSGAVTATSFAGNGANITAVNATTLDSIDSGSFLRSDATDTCSGQVTFTNQIITKQDGVFATQTGVALVVSNSTNTNMRGNHFIIDDFPSGGGTYFIQATESGVTNDRNLVLQGYAGKVGIGLTNPSERLDVNGNVKATSFIGNGAVLSGVVTSIVAGANITLTGGPTGIVTIASSGGGGAVGVSTSAGTFTATAGSPSTIDTIDYTSDDVKVIEYTLHFANGSDIQAQKLLVMQDNTNAFSNEYAIMSSSNKLVTVDAEISGDNVLVRATPETGVSGSTTFRWRREVQR